MGLRSVSFLFALALIAACKQEPAGRSPVRPYYRSFDVYEPGTDLVIMSVEGRPGELMGPGCKPPPGKNLRGEPHPFLNGRVLGAEPMKLLRGFIDEAKDPDDFALRLRVADFKVVQIGGPRVRWFHVFDRKIGDTPLLEMAIDDRPGYLTPGCTPQSKEDAHPFLHARFRSTYGRKLCPILKQSSDTDDFVKRLKVAGYTVEQVSGPQDAGR